MEVIEKDNEILFIHNNEEYSIIIDKDGIKSKNNNLKENLLINRYNKLVDDNNKINIDLCKSIIENLTDYCIICEKELEFKNEEFITCGSEKCDIQAEESIFNNYVKNYYVKQQYIFNFLMETAYLTINSNRCLAVFEPFPINFLKNKSILPKRGELTYLNNKNIEKINENKNIDKIIEIISNNSVQKIEKIIIECENDKKIQEKLGNDLYILIKFILNSNKTLLIYSNNVFNKEIIDDIQEFKIEHNYLIEDNFKIMKEKYGSRYLFHGSSAENWYSILRNGIKICSNSKLMTAGAAYGIGIYTSNDLNLSMGYTGFNNVCIFGIFEVINIKEKINNSGNIFVIQDDKILLLRYIYKIKNRKKIRELGLTEILNNKFNNKLQEEEKFIAKKCNDIRTKRIMGEYKKIIQVDDKNGFFIELENDIIDKWKLYITDFHGFPNIESGLKTLGIEAVELEIIFAEKYPIDPPFIRIVYPRFEYKTGHITSGGSICMELLTKSGWVSTYSIESLIIDIKSQILEGDGRIDIKRFDKYSLDEAKDSYKRVASGHGWII